MELTLVVTYDFTEEGYTVHAAFTDKTKLKAYLDVHDPDRTKYSLENAPLNIDINYTPPLFRCLISSDGIPCCVAVIYDIEEKSIFNHTRFLCDNDSRINLFMYLRAKSLKEAEEICAERYKKTVDMGLWPNFKIPTLEDVDPSFQIGKRNKLLNRLKGEFCDTVYKYSEGVQEKLNSLV